MNRIEKRGKVSIIDNKYVLKKENNLEDLYNYLLSRDFSNFLPVLERNDETNKYEYLNNYSLNKEQLGQDIASTMALLHNKTSYSKEVNIDNYKEIYDNILGYLNYIDEKYLNYIKQIEYIDFPSPSQLLFITNYSKVREAINFDKNELNAWYQLVKDKNKTRVALNHGNIRLDHAINNDKTYLISWENNSFDSPIVDLINFYRNEWDKVEFSSILDKYFSKCELTDDEKKLFFINISIPPDIKFKDDELDNIIIVRRIFDYIYKTERLIGPYYTIKDKEQ